MVCVCCACMSGRTEGGDGGDTIQLRYAHNLTLIQHKDYIEAVLRNPWDTTKVLNRYEIREPLKRVAVFTTVHCALMQELGVENCIAGICELEYISVQYVIDGVKSGRIVDLGNSLEPNIEMMMDLQPDAIMASPFENSGGYGIVERMGVPIIECADYMEASPLARAEWIRFYGRLFGVGSLADSVFSAVEKQYLSLKEQASTISDKPSLVVDKPYQGIWYVTGGGSTMGIMYQDAGVRYVFADRHERGSIPLSTEAVIAAGQEADYWLVKYSSSEPLTLKQLFRDNPIYGHFTSFANKRVYGCNTATSHFFEETPYHPERLLADIVSIMHPELNLATDHKYYHLLDEE